MHKHLLGIKIQVQSCELKHFQLRLVCKQYHQKPCSLPAAVFRDCARELLESLLQWLEGCTDSLQVVDAICIRECMEGLLEIVATLTCTGICRIIDTSAVSNRSVLLMAQCQLSTTCGLSDLSVSPFDLLSGQLYSVLANCLASRQIHYSPCTGASGRPASVQV